MKRLSEAKVKLLVKERDGYRCRKCGVTQEDHKREYGRGLEVHHTEKGPYSVRVCVTLCRKCHRSSQPKWGRFRSQPAIPALYLNVVLAEAAANGVAEGAHFCRVSLTSFARLSLMTVGEHPEWWTAIKEKAAKTLAEEIAVANPNRRKFGRPKKRK